jgi:hypothetical protein
MDLPTDVKVGKVVGRFLLAVGDSADVGGNPDAQAAVGTIKFTPRTPNQRVTWPEYVTVTSRPPLGTLDVDGYLVDGQGQAGIWLTTGAYDVTFLLKNVRINPIQILVTEDHTSVTPLDLALAIPPEGDPLGNSQYAELSDRIGGLEVIAGEGLTLEQLVPAMISIFSPGDDINIYQMDAPNDGFIRFNVMGLDAIRADIDALQLAVPPAYTDEQARDAASTMLVQGANITLTKDDAGDTVTIAATVPTPSSVPQVIDAKTASYTLVAGDVGKLITMNATSPMTLSIPTDASMTWAIGSRVDFLVLNTGMVTCAAVTPGTTSVVGTPTLVSRARYSAFSALKIAANSWAIIGDLA